MKKLISGAIFILTSVCLLIGAPCPAALAAAREPETRSAAVVLLNAVDGDVFYAKNETSRVQPADTAMLMTALLAVEAIETGSASLYSEVTVTEDALKDLPEGTVSLLSAGEVVPLEDLLYLAMLPSAVDACNAIAIFLGGSVEDFAGKMNQRAAELGCTDTYFTNAHGFFDERMHTTAADMARIALEAYQHQTLMKICSSPSALIHATNLSPARTVQNLNALLNGDNNYGGSYLYENASGLKNGFNGMAGLTLLASAEDPESGVRLIAAVFDGVWDEYGCSNYADTVRLLDWVFDNFSYQEVLNPSVSIASVDVRLGKDTDYVNLRPAGSVTLLLPADYDPGEIEYDFRVYSIEQGETVTAPVVAGETLGEVSVLRNGQICGSVKLVAATSVDLSRGQYIASHLRETIKTPGFFWLCFAVAVILGGYIAWVIVYRVRRKRYVNAVTEGGAPRRHGKRPAQPAARAAQEPEIEFFYDEDDGEYAAPAQVPMGDTTSVPYLSDIDAELGPLPTEEPLPPARTPPEAPSIGRDVGRDYFEEFFRRK